MKIFSLIILSFFFFISCRQKLPESVDNGSYYTCSMHPQIVSKTDGTCPVCHMQLILVKHSGNLRIGELLLSKEQIRLGNIMVDTIHFGVIGQSSTFPATIRLNQSTSGFINARVAGRIEKLYQKNVGDFVKEGTPVFDIYSDVLNLGKQEYLLALKQQQLAPEGALVNYHQLIESAKNRLIIGGMSEGQIAELKHQGTINYHTAIYADKSGNITSLVRNEGDYVMEGGAVLQLANLSSVWAEAQVNSAQLSAFDLKGSVQVFLPEIGNKTFVGSIDFINPEIPDGSRIDLVRVTIPNKDGLLKPGMAAYISLKSASHNALSLPTKSVIRKQNAAIVWIKTSENSFVPRTVKLGIETDQSIEILSGILEGDVVVTSGAYLLYSEFVFKNGIDP